MTDGSCASDTISRQSEEFSEKATSDEIRKIWLPAQYSSREATITEVKKIKAAVKNVREHRI